MCWLWNLGVEITVTQWLPTVNWLEMLELSWHAIKGKVLGRREWGLLCGNEARWLTKTEMCCLTGLKARSKFMSLG